MFFALLAWLHKLLQLLDQEEAILDAQSPAQKQKVAILNTDKSLHEIPQLQASYPSLIILAVARLFFTRLFDR